jgi:hypothetical protein
MHCLEATLFEAFRTLLAPEDAFTITIATAKYRGRISTSACMRMLFWHSQHVSGTPSSRTILVCRHITPNRFEHHAHERSERMVRGGHGR